MRNVLFIAPRYMNLYLDVIKEMENQGYYVDFIPEESFKEDPYNVRGYIRYGKIWVNKEKFVRKNRCRWKKILALEQYDKSYDILFVLDGQSLDSYLFDELKRRNPQIKTINYLFDTTTGVYRFDKFFSFFDRIVSFDPVEVDKYSLEYMPIYWIPSISDDKYKYDVFGLGAMSLQRFDLFSVIKQICLDNKFSFYLKLLPNFKVNSWMCYRIRCFIRQLIGLGNTNIPIDALKSDFIIHEGLSPEIFRKFIANSNIIIDTSAPHQDGFTARFMWALGAGKKIITTNLKVVNTTFYNEKQIFLYSEDVKRTDIVSFMEVPYTGNSDNIDLLQARIDNWTSFMLK